MFAVITLETSLKVKVIPVEWIRGFDFIGSINDGINASETHVVFYCDNLNQRPNFGLPIFSVVREEYEGCYWARINKFFGTYNIFPSLHEMNNTYSMNLTSMSLSFLQKPRSTPNCIEMGRDKFYRLLTVRERLIRQN